MWTSCFAHSTRSTPASGTTSPVCGTQESDRIASLAPAQTEVRAGAVLPGSRGSEYQAARAVPQPTDNTYYGSCLLAEVRRKTRPPQSSQPKKHSDYGLFQHPHLLSTVDVPALPTRHLHNMVGCRAPSTVTFEEAVSMSRRSSRVSSTLYHQTHPMAQAASPLPTGTFNLHSRDFPTRGRERVR